jgi:hypothetical protein
LLPNSFILISNNVFDVTIVYHSKFNEEHDVTFNLKKYTDVKNKVKKLLNIKSERLRLCIKTDWMLAKYLKENETYDRLRHRPQIPQHYQYPKHLP